MKRKKLSLKHLWIQFEDFLFPRLRLSITDRAVYSHLLRHSRLEGRLQRGIPHVSRHSPFVTRLPAAAGHYRLTLCLARAALAFRSAAQPFLISDSPIGISSG